MVPSGAVGIIGILYAIMFCLHVIVKLLLNAPFKFVMAPSGTIRDMSTFTTVVCFNCFIVLLFCCNIHIKGHILNHLSKLMFKKIFN